MISHVFRKAPDNIPVVFPGKVRPALNSAGRAVNSAERHRSLAERYRSPAERNRSPAERHRSPAEPMKNPAEPMKSLAEPMKSLAEPVKSLAEPERCEVGSVGAKIPERPGPGGIEPVRRRDLYPSDRRGYNFVMESGEKKNKKRQILRPRNTEVGAEGAVASGEKICNMACLPPL